MGKLNYSARKISGVKAGHVVSKDLKKRMAPGSGSKAAARDPTLEIDLTGKGLTDDGFAEFIDDLISCINCRDAEHPLGLAKVTELHLQNNKLTVQSLLKLGDVIASSGGDLRELDLSRNDIRIVTEEERTIWKLFLGSFKNCYMLKKLDLAGNPIGTAGLEILARGYIKSDLDFLEADAEAIVRQDHGFSTDVQDGEEAALAEETAALKIDVKASWDCKSGCAKKSPSKVGRAARQNGAGSTAVPASKNITFNDLKQYACTRGLRSIPYFILSEIEVKNSSAVHLSRMLATQRSSEQLLEFLPHGKASAIPESARGDRSIIWKPIDGFTGHARRLLDVTEAIRHYKSRAQGGSEGNRSDDEDSTDEAAKHKSQNKLELDHTRLTKRVRIESLKQEGLHASEIATVALKMMVVSRALLLEDRDRAVEASEDVAANEEFPVTEEHDVEEQEQEQEQEQEEEEEEGHAEEELIVEHSPSSVEFHPQPQYTIPPAFSPSFSKGRFHPGTELFDEEFPALQPVYRPATPKVATPEPENEGYLELNSLRDTTPERSVFGAGNVSGPDFGSVRTGRPTGGKGNTRASLSQKGRKSSWRFGLTFNLWRRIIAEAVGANGILDQEQQARILHYASDWDSVAYELTIKGAENHQQIWKFLDTVRCFTYTPLN